MKTSWNKGLTKDTSEKIRKIAEQKSLWWKTHNTTETRKKIGDSSRGRNIGKTGEKSPGWKGGRYTTKRDKYVFIYKPDHPFAKRNGKGGGGYVLEHRFIMEGILGRYLNKQEDVHHKNGIKDDNRPENLMLISHNHHYQVIKCPKCDFEFHIQ